MRVLTQTHLLLWLEDMSNVKVFVLNPTLLGTTEKKIVEADFLAIFEDNGANTTQKWVSLI